MKNIPIFINNFNRLKPTVDLCECLLKRNYNNIFVIDNASTYSPLLEWYDKRLVNIVKLNVNLGPGAIDQLPQLKPQDRLYVWTDSDIVPVDEIPNDFLDNMIEMIKEIKCPKLGLSLKIDDLPDHYKHKQEVIKHESIFTTLGHVDNKYCRVYKAPTDTTFAINVPGIPCGYNGEAWRTGAPYTARHAPWYYDSANLPEDEKLLRANVPAHHHTHWSKKQG
jgi:hypothetical protein